MADIQTIQKQQVYTKFFSIVYKNFKMKKSQKYTSSHKQNA